MLQYSRAKSLRLSGRNNSEILNFGNAVMDKQLSSTYCLTILITKISTYRPIGEVGLSKTLAPADAKVSTQHRFVKLQVAIQ